MVESTYESEYIAISEASKEVVWITNFLGDLGVVPSNEELLYMFYDKEGEIALTTEHRDHGRSRHILRKFHYI